MQHNFGRTLLIVGLAALASPALADRGPSKEEAQAIAAKLTAEGFKSWEDIELDDNMWEVDNARSIDGNKYDLKLNTSYEIVKKDRD
ncbi:MAG: PepSY domain-containing protein [Sphingomonadaceae bacterium]